MSPTSGTVLLIQSNTQLSLAAVSDLALAGFELVSVTDRRKLLETARRHTVVAIVLEEGFAGLLWRRLKRDPDLRRVPVVVLAPRRPRQLLPWPLGPFVRADAYVSAADLERRGAAADAVRALISREDHVVPTSRERFGEALWNVGSVLAAVGLLLAIAGFPFTLRSGPGRVIEWGILSLATGNVLLNVGERLGLGQRLGLQWQSWVWLAVALSAVRVLFAHSP